jgi:uncharacterized integral membrane protein (TIGR00698 family)
MSSTYLLQIAAPWYPAALRRNWPGVALAIVIALAASFISATYGGPQLLFALFFGLAFHSLSNDPASKPGIDFCSKTLLRTGVALLGAKITFAQIGSLGVAPVVMVIGAVFATLAFGWALARVLGRPATEGLLTGGSVAICGASAAFAIASVLPQTEENEKFTLMTVVGVTTMSTIAMIVYPLIVRFAGLDPTAGGIFLGGTIHDVAQVVGAGYLISNHTGDVATVVKLTRVACLVPIVIGIAMMFKARGAASEVDIPPLIPFFLIGFIGMMVINSYGWMSPGITGTFNTASRACLMMAIAALGVKTSFQALASLGWRPVLMLVADSVWIALFVMAAIYFHAI